MIIALVVDGLLVITVGCDVERELLAGAGPQLLRYVLDYIYGTVVRERTVVHVEKNNIGTALAHQI